MMTEQQLLHQDVVETMQRALDGMNPTGFKLAEFVSATLRELQRTGFPLDDHGEYASLENLTKMARAMLEGRKVLSPTDRDWRLWEFCEWELEQPIPRDDGQREQWHRRMVGAGFGDLTAADLRRAFEMMRREGERLKAEGDALQLHIQCRKLGLFGLEKFKEGPDHA